MTDDQNSQKNSVNLVLTHTIYSMVDYFTAICMRNYVTCLQFVHKQWNRACAKKRAQANNNDDNNNNNNNNNNSNNNNNNKKKKKKNIYNVQIS